MGGFADLHLHTEFSDGTYTPQELVLKAKAKGLSIISVVDHDTVEGISPTIKVANDFGIEVLPGIELTAEYQGNEVHILGYLVDYQDKDFIAKLDLIRKDRVGRIYAMVEKLKGLGLNIEAQEIFDLAKEGTVGRLHIARVLLAKGYISTIAEAFTKYIGEKSPAYVCGFRFPPEEAAELIKSVKGIPVLAHPYFIKQDELILKFIDSGVMGIEAYYPEHTQSMVNFYLRLAQEHNLLVTGGSDCHGGAKTESKIGRIKLPSALVDKIKEKQSLMYG